MRIDKTNTPYKLASDLAEITKTLRITPHGITKLNVLRHTREENSIVHFRKNSSSNNLNWEKAKDACLDCKILQQSSRRSSKMVKGRNHNKTTPRKKTELTQVDLTTSLDRKYKIEM